MFDRFGVGAPSPFGVRSGILAIGVHAALLAYGLHGTTGKADPGKPVLDTTIFITAAPRHGIAMPLPAIPAPGPIADPSFRSIPITIPTVPGGTVEPGPILMPTGTIGAPPGNPDSVYDVGLVEQVPELLSSPPPRYPEPLRLAHIEGLVAVEGVVDTLGHFEPKTLHVICSPHPALAASALESLTRALFRPGRVYGRAVRVLVQVPVQFTIGRR